MNYNNSTNRQIHRLIAVITLVMLLSVQTAQRKSKLLQDLPQISIAHRNNSWLAQLDIAHHTLQLTPKILPCRTWIKSSQCKICESGDQKCQNQKTCFLSQRQPRVSCDSAFCEKGNDFEDSQTDIEGFQAEVFGKLGSSQQILIPLVFASKLGQPTQTNGEFCLLDNESSFNEGLLHLKNKIIQLINTKVNIKETNAVKQASLDTFAIKIHSSQIGLQAFKSKTVAMINSQPLAYKDITYHSTNEYKIQLSLQQIGISVPLRMLHQIQSAISSIYFPTNNCRFTNGKIKCSQQLSFGGLTEAMLQFRFAEDGFNLSLPIHMLIGSCASKSCSFLLQSHNSSDTVIIGSIFLQAFAFQWDLDAKKMWFHRLNNQWADPYRVYKIDPNKKGFLANMFTLLFHIVLYMIYSILALAALSLAINCLMRWREVVDYLKSIVTKVLMRKRGMSALEQEEYFVAEVSERQPGVRRTNKLQQAIDDQL